MAVSQKKCKKEGNIGAGNTDIVSESMLACMCTWESMGERLCRVVN